MTGGIGAAEDRTMNRVKISIRVALLSILGLAPIFGACVTTNQLQNFIRTEIAIVTTQILTEPIDDMLQDLTGPQIIEEVVPSI